MIKNQNDMRVVKTKKAIEETFSAQLEQMPFEEITVKDICQSAMVGSATFYYHYRDKYDLARHLVHKYLAELREAMLWQLSLLDAGMSEAEAWDLIADVKKELSLKRRRFQGIHTDRFDFQSELLTMLRKMIVERQPNSGLPELEYERQTGIAARQLLDYFSYVEDTDDFLPLKDYLAKGQSMLARYHDGNNGAQKESSDRAVSERRDLIIQ